MSRYVSMVYALPPALRLSLSIALSRAFSRVLSLVLSLARSFSLILSPLLVLSRVLSISLYLVRALSLSLSLSSSLSSSLSIFGSRSPSYFLAPGLFLSLSTHLAHTHARTSSAFSVSPSTGILQKSPTHFCSLTMHPYTVYTFIYTCQTTQKCIEEQMALDALAEGQTTGGGGVGGGGGDTSRLMLVSVLM